jgi:hypothetical protein
MVARRCILWTLLPWTDKLIVARGCVAPNFLGGIERELLSYGFVRPNIAFPLPALPPEEVHFDGHDGPDRVNSVWVKVPYSKGGNHGR